MTMKNRALFLIPLRGPDRLRHVERLLWSRQLHDLSVRTIIERDRAAPGKAYHHLTASFVRMTAAFHRLMGVDGEYATHFKWHAGSEL